MEPRTAAALLILCLVSAGCVGVFEGDADELEATNETEAGGDGGDEAGANATGPGTSPAGSGPTVHSVNGTFTAEAVNSGVDSGDRSLEVRAPAGAAAIVAELRWQGTADLDLAMLSPQFCEEGPVPEAPDRVSSFACRAAFFATGDADHAYGTDRSQPAIQEKAAEVRVDQSTIQDESCDEDTCTWTAHINPNLAVDTSFELKVSVFPDQAPGEGYSAFGDGS